MLFWAVKNLINIMIKIVLLLFLVFLFSCQQVPKQKKILVTSDKDTLAIIGDGIVSSAELDSILSPQIYDMKKQMLEMVVARKLMEKEAKMKNISLEELNNIYIGHKCEMEGNDEQSKYKYYSCLQDERQVYVDSLKAVYKVKTLLMPPFFREINTDSLHSYSLNTCDDCIKVYIVSDFECHACRGAHSIVNEILEKYKNKVQFEFVYYSGYVNICAQACEAADKQGKLHEMLTALYKAEFDFSDKESYLNIANDLQLDIDLFSASMDDKATLRPFIKAKDFLYEKHVFSTPSFIVNGKVLDEKYAINYLDKVIDEELYK